VTIPASRRSRDAIGQDSVARAESTSRVSPVTIESPVTTR
jgi:hypothetical protein